MTTGTEPGRQLVPLDPWAYIEPEARAELEEESEAGYRDVENGDVVDARAYLEQLLANRT